VDRAAEAAFRAGTDVFAADDRRVAQDTVGNERWVFDKVGGMLRTPGISILPAGSFGCCQMRHSCSCRTLPASKE
jgi:hypothetical protein